MSSHHRTVDDHTMFSVHAQVKYKKSVWGVVKGFIEKNTWAGLEDFYTALLRALQSEYCIPPAKAKGRRRNRGTTGSRTPMLTGDTAAVNGTDLVNSAKVSFAVCSATTASPTSKVAFGTGIAINGGGATLAPNKLLSSPLCVTAKISVIVLLAALVLLNVILYIKLWSLEDETAANSASSYQKQLIDFHILK